jgi:glycosyltransferase involved in cell wall biosynthesis
MEPAPIVSVILPVFNGARYIRIAIESVLKQTFGNFELLVLDDGSTDGSLAIARSFVAKDRRIHVITRENRGLVSTLNELIVLARGEFVARLDADDVCLPDRLQRQTEFMLTHPEVVCLGGDVELIDDCGRFLAVQRMFEANEDIQREALRGNTPICHPSVLIRTSVLRQLGGYRQEYYLAEDLDLWLRMGELGILANLSGPVLRYRLHDASVSSMHPKQQQEVARRCCRDAWQRRGIRDGHFAVKGESRPTSDRRSQFDFTLRLGWWAFNSGERRTSLVYGVRAVCQIPTSFEGWRLLICTLIKPMQQPSATR